MSPRSKSGQHCEQRSLLASRGDRSGPRYSLRPRISKTRFQGRGRQNRRHHGSRPLRCLQTTDVRSRWSPYRHRPVLPIAPRFPLSRAHALIVLRLEDFYEGQTTPVRELAPARSPCVHRDIAAHPVALMKSIGPRREAPRAVLRRAGRAATARDCVCGIQLPWGRSSGLKLTAQHRPGMRKTTSWRWFPHTRGDGGI